jgi:hypothetical protein
MNESKELNKSPFKSIKEWPKDERPREKLIKHGPEYLTNVELLAIIIRTGIAKKDSSLSSDRPRKKNHHKTPMPKKFGQCYNKRTA